jgi:hypothetical protein
MKKFIFLLSFIFFYAHYWANSQSWIRYYGYEKNAECSCILNDYDEGYVIGGNIIFYKYIWLLKTDINGNILWNKTIGDSTYNAGIGNVEKTSDGGFILCGSWTKNHTSWDVFIIKLNPCAGIEWCITLSTPNNGEVGVKVKQTQEGDYILLGEYFNTNPESHTSLFKFNNNGELIWHQFYQMDSVYFDDQPQDLLVDTDGYLITAQRNYPNPGTSSPAIMRSYFIKTDTAGIKNWDLVYGVNEYYYGYPACLNKSITSAYYQAGIHIQEILNYYSSPALIKLATNGTPLFDRDIITNVYWGYLSSIDFLEDSLLIMVGAYCTNPNATREYVLIKSDTLGNLRKIKYIPKANLGYVSVCKTLDNKFVAVGNYEPGYITQIVAVKVNSDLEYDSIYTQPYTYDSLCPHPIVSDTIDPNCDNVYVSVDEPFKKPETTQLKVYPNPTDNMLIVELPKYLVVTNNSGNIPATTIYHQWSSAILQAIDLQGKTVLQQEVANSGTPLQVDVSELKAGMYLFSLVYKGNVVAGSKVVVR